MSAKDVVERTIYDDDGNPIQVPVASVVAPGIAQFEAEDFAVTDEGVVSSLQKVGSIQYIGIPTPTSTATCQWTLIEGSAAPLDEARKGQLVMSSQVVLSEYGDVITGDVFIIESVVGNTVTTSMTPITSLRGPQGEKGDTGEAGKDGADGVDGKDGADGGIVNLTIGTVQEGETADATISGDGLDKVLNLVLPKGEKGDTGTSFTIKFSVDTVGELPDAKEEYVGLAAFVGVSAPRDVYVCIYKDGAFEWENEGPISGSDGEDGIDALVRKSISAAESPVLGNGYRFTYNMNDFSREPSVGDNFFTTWTNTDTSQIYFIIAYVNSISTLDKTITFSIADCTLIFTSKVEAAEKLYDTSVVGNTTSQALDEKRYYPIVTLYCDTANQVQSTMLHISSVQTAKTMQNEEATYSCGLLLAHSWDGDAGHCINPTLVYGDSSLIDKLVVVPDSEGIPSNITLYFVTDEANDAISVKQLYNIKNISDSTDGWTLVTEAEYGTSTTVLSGAYSRELSTYLNLVTEATTAEQLVAIKQIYSKLSDYLSSEYWGKVIYATANWSPKDAPDGVTGAYSVQILRGSDDATIQMLITTSASADDTGCIYIRDSVNTEWVQFAKSNGTYSDMSVGQAEKLSKTIYIKDGSYTGWTKIADIEITNESIVYNNITIMMLVSGIYNVPSNTVYPGRSGLIEIRIRKSTSISSTSCINILSGYLSPDEFCYAVNGNVVSVYWKKVNSTSMINFTVLDEVVEHKDDYLVTYGPSHYGADAPDDAVYANLRVNADTARSLHEFLIENTLGTSGKGWWKIGSLKWEDINYQTAYGVMFLIHEVYGRAGSGYGQCGLLKLEAQLISSSKSFSSAGVGIFAGNLDTTQICITNDGTTIDLYYYMDTTYEATIVSILSQGDEKQSVKTAFKSENTFYGTSAPSGAIYAVNYNTATNGATFTYSSGTLTITTT